MEVRSRRADCEVAGHNRSSGISGAPESPVRRGEGCRAERVSKKRGTNRNRQPPAEAEPPQKWETTKRGL